jgi:RimJ/RimL family protein N-acetyltransferase
VVIPTSRFVLRSLTIADATPRYIAWFADAESARHIVFAKHSRDLALLRRYIGLRAGRPDVLFLGIFTREGGEHIGNIKYEPVDTARGLAVMGILIGDQAWRGRGVAAEVISASTRWLCKARRIRRIELGVHLDHRRAIHTYRRLGFRPGVRRSVSRLKPATTMVWRLSA